MIILKEHPFSADQIIVFDRERFLPLIDKLTPNLDAITASALGIGLSPGLHNKVESKLRHADYCLLITEEDRGVGFGFYNLIPITVGETPGTILYEDTKMVRPDRQGQGVGSEITQVAVTRLAQGLRSDCVFMLRTQNPAEVLSVGHTLPHLRAFNEHDEFHQDALRSVTRFFGIEDKVDFFRGIFHPAQPDAHAGNYQINIHDPRIGEIEELFRQRGLDRKYGDFLYFLATMKKVS